MKRLFALLSCVIVVLLAGPAGVAGERRYDFQKKVLDNGLTVITLEDFSCPIVGVNLWYHVGSKDEDPNRQGFAHMFEHMMFKGTDRIGRKDHFELIRGTGGNTNAGTNFDFTVYLEELPANQLELALWLEAERMVFLKVDEENFDTERKVVEEERRQRNLNPPYGKVFENVAAGMFKKHPYRWLPIGKIPHLRSASIEDLEAFWAKFYVPNNATLVIVGAVKHEEAQALAQKYFGWIGKCPLPPRVTVREPQQTEPRELRVKERKGPFHVAGVLVHTVPAGHDDAVPLSVMSSILAGGRSSRLYVELIKKDRKAAQLIPLSFSLEQEGVAGIAAVALPFAKPADIMKIVESHIDRMMNEPISARELQKIKNQMLRGEIAGTMTVMGKARRLGSAATIFGDPERVNQTLDRIRAVTVEDVQRVAKKYFAPELRTKLWIEPETNPMMAMMGGQKKSEPDPEETEVPSPTPSAENRVAKRTGPKGAMKRPEGFPEKPPLRPLLKSLPEFPNVETTLSNGLRVVAVENHELPFVSVFVGLPYGSWSEAKPGVASMAAAMLTRGTAKQDAAALAETLEFNAISVGGSADRDTAGVSGSCLTEQTPRMMELFAEVITSANFPDAELQILRQQAVQGLQTSEKNPAVAASREINSRLYGDHPYGRRVSGEIDDIQAISRDDLEGWWKQVARPKDAILYVAGDVNPQEFFKLAEKTLGGWKATGDAPKMDFPAFPKQGKTKIILVDKPGASQSEIRAGHRAHTRSHPDWHSSLIAVSILGGGFNSRLNEALRQKKGLTYGASGSFSGSKFGGAFSASTSTKTERTAEAVQTMLDTLEEMRSGPPTAKEMDTTRSFMVGRFAGRWETPQTILGDLWFMDSMGLKRDYFQRAIAAYNKTTAEEVQRIVKEQIDPANMTIVVAGDASRIKADLEKIAPVEVVSGKPKRAEKPAGKTVEKPAPAGAG